MRFGLTAAFALLISGAYAADPIRGYVAPNGGIWLWLKRAPSVVAVDQAGWQITPKAAETNATWLQRLKTIYPEEPGSPWKALLEDLRAGVARQGVEQIQPKATLAIRDVTSDRLTVAVSGPPGTISVPFKRENGNWRSADVGKLDAWLRATAPGADARRALYRFASASAPASASPADAWGAFVAAAARSTTSTPLVLEGDRPVVVETVPFSPPVSSNRPLPPKIETPPGQTKTKEAEPAPSAWLPAVLAGFVGLAAGFGIRSAIRPKKQPAPTPPDDAALRRRLADSVAEAERLAADLDRARAALNEANRAAKQYRDEHGAWLRDRDEAMRAAARAEELAGLLKAAEDAKNRTESEMSRQIQSLQGKVQSHETRAATLATKARAYTSLHREVMDAFNFLQGEIGRPEVAAVVGYLLNYSVANLMDTLLAPNPALERAMLSNIARIAGCVSNLPHVRKAAATADGLLKPLGVGPIPESTEPHPYSSHIGGLLRILRNQLNVELAPFYVAVDGEGKANAVYI